MGLLHSRRGGILRSHELPQGWTRFRGRSHHGESAVRARNHDSGIRVWPGRPAASSDHLLTGILNGVDYEEWNTTNNPYLVQPYSKEQLGGKAVNKARLQEEIGLPIETDTP